MIPKLIDEKTKVCKHFTIRGLELTRLLKFNNCLES